MREVVKINNEQEWEYVKEKINNPEGLLYFKKYESTKGVCINVRNGKYDYVDYYKREGYTIISFEEFKSRYEPQLKIGDTFEKDGFICRVESEAKVWAYNVAFNEYKKVFRAELTHKNLTEITDQEFISQLEKFAK